MYIFIINYRFFIFFCRPRWDDRLSAGFSVHNNTIPTILILIFRSPHLVVIAIIFFFFLKTPKTHNKKLMTFSVFSCLWQQGAILSESPVVELKYRIACFDNYLRDAHSPPHQQRCKERREKKKHYKRVSREKRDRDFEKLYVLKLYIAVLARIRNRTETD